MLRGEEAPFTYRGDTTDVAFQMAELGFVNVTDPVPIHVSAFGPKGQRLAGAYGDGLVVSVPPIRKAVERSLRRLRTEWIDLYQVHRPDPATPIEETLAALGELIAEGKVRYIGSSNLSAWQVADADWTARSRGLDRFVSAQNEYSLLERAVETELLPACARFGVGLLPWFPLANGMLTGKYHRDQTPDGGRLANNPGYLSQARFDVVEAVAAFADQRGVSVLEVAIGALLARPEVSSVIAGATRPEQVRSNAAASAWRPAADDLDLLDAITRR
jgi:aryl-alcohol dehydrogenase-like predicted oxidoreductase